MSPPTQTREGSGVGFPRVSGDEPVRRAARLSHNTVFPA